MAGSYRALKLLAHECQGITSAGVSWAFCVKTVTQLRSISVHAFLLLCGVRDGTQDTAICKHFSIETHPELYSAT